MCWGRESFLSSRKDTQSEMALFLPQNVVSKHDALDLTSVIPVCGEPGNDMCKLLMHGLHSRCSYCFYYSDEILLGKPKSNIIHA